MENNINEILGVTQEKKQEINKMNKINVSKENLLDKISHLILIIGILGGIIFLFSCFPDVGTYRVQREFNPIIFSYGVVSILFSILNYAFMQVVIQISLSLKNKTSLDN